MTETSATLELAGDFAPANYDQWRQLVEKALKGGDFDKRLVARTADGLQVKPLYTRADALDGPQGAVPGAAPFTRGTASRTEGLGWQIAQRVVEPDPSTANGVILEELEGGATGVVLQIAGPGQIGMRIGNVADMAAALAGVHLDFAPIALAGGIDSLAAARHLLGARAALKAKTGTAAFRLNVDPIGTLARFGMTWGPLEAALADTVKLSGEARASGAPHTTVLVDATVPHEAGASEAQELAYLAAALVAYLRAFEAAGVTPADALPEIAFALSVDTDLFLTAAKIRAARTLIARIGEAASTSAGSMHITAVTSARMMAKRDPWTNMLRTTAASAGAAFGGADAVTVLPYTWALGVPDRFARRTARNTQLVLQEESALGRVVDPVGGSWYVEQLTAELAAKAWELFQDIESKGGVAGALDLGRPAERRCPRGRGPRQGHRDGAPAADRRLRLSHAGRGRRQGYAQSHAATSHRRAPGARPRAPSCRRAVRGAPRCRRRAPRQDRHASARLSRQPRRDRRAQHALDVGVELPGSRRH